MSRSAASSLAKRARDGHENAALRAPRAAPPRVAMVEIEEEETLGELSVTELKRMKEAEVITGTCQHTVTCLAAPTPCTGSHA